MLYLLQYSYIYLLHFLALQWRELKARSWKKCQNTKHLKVVLKMYFLLILVWHMNWHVLGNGFHEIHSIMWNKTQHTANQKLPGNTSSTIGNYMIIYFWYVSGVFHQSTVQQVYDIWKCHWLSCDAPFSEKTIFVNIQQCVLSSKLRNKIPTACYNWLPMKMLFRNDPGTGMKLSHSKTDAFLKPFWMFLFEVK